MGIALIKKINEYIPYWIKKPFSEIIRNKLIRNKEFLNTYHELEKYDSISANEKNDIQLKKLQLMLIHAYNHTSYYRKLFESIGLNVQNIDSLDDLKKIPVLTKETLKQHFNEILADDIHDYYLVTTGGTSGEPTKVQMEKNAIYREWAFVYHYWSKFGYNYETSKLATFRGVDLGDRLWKINPLYSEIRLNPFALSEKNIEKYINAIIEYGAEFIYGYPSAVYNFCRIADKKGIKLENRFNAAFLISENLYKFQEEMIKKVLQCEVAMFYGHSERAVFAERYDGVYLFNLLYGVTELSENNEPIVTGFINGKTPLIRYLVDDQIKKVDTGFDIIGHHSSEVLIGYHDERVAMASVNFHDDTFKNVKAYQFVQYQAGKCILRIEEDEKLTNNDLLRIKSSVERKLGIGFECVPQIVDTIEISRRGKYKMLISKIDVLENMIEEE